MNFHAILQKVTLSLRQSVTVQLVALLAALPFLAWWGLALSYMSIIGNIIFLPFLTLFLLISSLIFFTELVHLPNDYLVTLLNGITWLWHTLLLQGKKEWLISFIQPPMLILIPLSLFIITILCLQKNLAHKQKIVMLTMTIIFSVTTLVCYQYYYVASDLTHTDGLYDKNIVLFLDKERKLVLIDDGFFNRKPSPEKTILYEIIPFIRKQYGTTHFSSITIQRPHARSFHAIIELSHICTIEKVILPYFEKNLSRKDWFFFFKMKDVLGKAGIRLQRKNVGVPKGIRTPVARMKT